jgi:carboxyl-terminal processing protease
MGSFPVLRVGLMGNPKTSQLPGLMILLGCSVFVLLSIVLFAFLLPQDASEAPNNIFGLEEKGIVLFLEAVTRIQKDALFLSPNVPRQRIVQDTLKSYLQQHDAFSDYLTREEYLRFKELQAEDYVGIGMQIQKDRDGRILCFPYPRSPAEQAGISVGDQLQSIDGVAIHGQSLVTVATMVRGKEGTKIRLTVTTKSGMEKQVVATCSEVKIESVATRRLDNMTVIGVLRFTRNTPEKLRETLSHRKENEPVLIDLRSNSGGDLGAAIESAMLFVEEGKRIVTIETRNGSMVRASNSRPLALAYPIYLWQDEATASAAEVFIAALTENKKAVSIGKRTFGKGTKQDVIELSDGSALILTTGRLQTPDGRDYQGVGLNPTHELKDNDTKTIDYLSEVKALMGSSNGNSSVSVVK